jgi:predicted nucleic acid-binding protein
MVATQFLGHFQTGLRAGDALHLAVVSNHQYKIYTLDNGLMRAAKILQLDCCGSCI